MSINMLRSDKRVHGVKDDVESCFYVLYKEALERFQMQPFRSLMPDKYATDEFFTQQTKEVEHDDTEVYSGGENKINALIKDKFFSKVAFESKPLTRVIRAFAEVLATYYRSKYAIRKMEQRGGDDQSEAFQRATDEYLEAYEKLCNVTDIIQILDDAIGSNDWPKHNDAVMDDPQGTDEEERSGTPAILADLRAGKVSSGDGAETGQSPNTKKRKRGEDDREPEAGRVGKGRREKDVTRRKAKVHARSVRTRARFERSYEV